MNTVTSRIPYKLERLGVLMKPQPGNLLEVEGVLNPATIQKEPGELFLYPRLVAEGNVSRVGRCKVELADSVPVDVTRLGVVLEPEGAWERGANNAGVEDPRITRIDDLDVYIMTYIAYGPLGPKPAMAVSRDGEEWERIGPIHFEYQPELSTDLNMFPNKDIVVFPEAVTSPDGKESYAVLHRPMWDLDWLRPGEGAPLPAGIEDPRPSIWIGFVDAEAVRKDLRNLVHIENSRLLAAPEMPYEESKIGAGPAPIRVPEGWLLIHHGVTGAETKGFGLAYGARYTAGAILLDAERPWIELGRTLEPLLTPETPEELAGTLGNVVFPTAIEKIDGRYYVFYGMADSQIGVATLERIDE